MTRQVTKAGDNRYCQARLDAAKWNEKLLTRVGAADVIGCVTEDSIKKYELGLTKPPNDIVAVMADAYNTPELVLWYCSNECPLGKNCREVPNMPPERTYVRMTNTLNKLSMAMQELAGIMDNGIDGEAEQRKIPKIWEEFLEARRRIDEILTVFEKTQRRRRNE